MPTGSIVGDVYLVMQSGDVKRGAGQWLHLIPVGEPDSAITEVCAVLHDQLRGQGEQVARVDQARKADADRRRRLFTQMQTEQDSISKLLARIRDRRRSGELSPDSFIKLVNAEDPTLEAWERRRAMLVESLAVLDRLPAVQFTGQSVAELEAAARIRLIGAFLGSSAESAKANIDARFAFDSVPPGDYYVFGMTTIGINQYAWWAPTTVVAGDTVRRDLDNEVEMADRLFSCQDVMR